jgi:hypothetical protein
MIAKDIALSTERKKESDINIIGSLTWLGQFYVKLNQSTGRRIEFIFARV